MAKKSGRFVVVALLLTIGLAAGYIYYVHDWYWYHSAIICTPELKINARPADYCHVSEHRPDDYDPYLGQNKFWGDDIISNFFANLSQLIMKYIIEVANVTIVPWFNDRFVLEWNTFAADEKHRATVAAIFGILYAASATKVLSRLHDKIADGQS